MGEQHWHVFWALPGYLPEGDVTVIDDAVSAAQYVSDELGFDLGSCDDVMVGLGEAGEFEEAYRVWQRANELEAAAGSLDMSRRAVAPLYVNDPGKLHELASRLLMNGSPWLSAVSHLRLYANVCEEHGCVTKDS